MYVCNYACISKRLTFSLVHFTLSRAYSQVFYDPNQAIMIRVSKEGCKNGCAANVNIDGNVHVYARMLVRACVRACVRAPMRPCVRAPMRPCASACVRVRGRN